MKGAVSFCAAKCSKDWSRIADGMPKLRRSCRESSTYKSAPNQPHRCFRLPDIPGIPGARDSRASRASRVHRPSSACARPGRPNQVPGMASHITPVPGMPGSGVYPNPGTRNNRVPCIQWTREQPGSLVYFRSAALFGHAGPRVYPEFGNARAPDTLGTVSLPGSRVRTNSRDFCRMVHRSCLNLLPPRKPATLDRKGPPLHQGYTRASGPDLRNNGSAKGIQMKPDQ